MFLVEFVCPSVFFRICDNFGCNEQIIILLFLSVMPDTRKECLGLQKGPIVF